MDKLKGKKIFVTGGAGFIGANLVRRLLEEKAEIYVLARSSTNLWRLCGMDDVRFYFVDLSDFDTMRKILSIIKPDGVFHLAASMMVRGVILEPDKVMKVNVDAIKNILECVSPDCFFINTGTFSDGESDDFAKSKLMGTQYCADFGKKNQRPVVTVRIFTPYGPYIQSGRFVSTILVDMIRGVDIKAGSPDVVRDFIYVDDIVDLYFAVAEKAQKNCGEIFEAGSGVSTTLKEAADIALRITGSQSQILWGNVAKLSYDSDKIKAHIGKNISCLGWKPKTLLREGLQKTHDWLKENLDKY